MMRLLEKISPSTLQNVVFIAQPKEKDRSKRINRKFIVFFLFFYYYFIMNLHIQSDFITMQ